MILKKYFYPDLKLSSVLDIDISELLSRGIKFALLDIDNTLVPYTSPEPDDNAKSFLKKLDDNGIRYCFVSNNSKKRVELFNQSIGAYTFPRAKKPLLTGVNKAIKQIEAKKEEVVFIGDQIFTDTLCGKRLGVFTVLVDPIIECTTLFFRFKRYFEKIILKKYLKERMNKDD